MNDNAALKDRDYAALADFRHTLRSFQAFSAAKAAEAGLTSQQHQALLAIRAAPPGEVTIGYVAERLIVKPHSATGLVDRLEVLGLVDRQATSKDRRRSILHLTEKADKLLVSLSAAHRDEIRRLKLLLAELLARIG